MVKLGFALYPEGYDLQEIKDYIDLLAKQGSERVFMSLLQLLGADTTTFEHYRRVIAYCNQKSLLVFADLNPELIDFLGWKDNLLEKAQAFGLSGIRLDEVFGGIDYLVDLSHQASAIKIELNMSGNPTLIQALVAKGANLQQITACHNFYPHRLTGLSTDYFLRVSKIYKNLGIETAAFINAKSAEIGPWPVKEGLCTLEAHRHSSINAQWKWLKASHVIDHVIIANQFISKEELISLSSSPVPELSVSLNESISPIEQAIVKELHYYRGEVSDYVVRSTGHRAKYQRETIPLLFQDKQVDRGAILIDNSLYPHYCGELQIALKSFGVDDKVNIVGHVVEDDLALLELLQPWTHFKLVIKDAGK
ncbi:DUF871 domain-containing protein [Streptococcus halichoeri]|uniref:DUF871 domain-containing protein n=1 Tax=Streptococcus halichoeri TaxID=254785 RepID=UPI001358F08D|nr:MupG family TIM beta-alpha barrel fold protein [Streptococcus halichoeri]